jgi:Fe-S-cluster-containing dehydrogenase component
LVDAERTAQRALTLVRTDESEVRRFIAALSNAGDRAAAVRSGVGWWGRSTLVLAPGHGPWLLLGSVVTDAPLPTDEPMRRDCGTCDACLPACPTGAIWKRQDNGIVDIDSTLCIGCRRCEATCPYGAPQFIPDQNIVSKCNLCVDEIEAGRKPYCVMACMMRVLDIGPIDKLRENQHETKAIGPEDAPVRAVKNFANPELTNPSIVFVPHSKGKVE